MRYSIEGRSTGQGAYTTMGGQRFNISRTGNHWEEVVDLAPGQTVQVVDISGTGKHRCRIMENVGGEIVPIKAASEDYWPGGQCPVCNVYDGDPVPNSMYALSVYIDAEGMEIDGSAEAYIDGELQPDVRSGVAWEHFPVAEISFFCDAHKSERLTTERGCPVCGRIIADI